MGLRSGERAHIGQRSIVDNVRQRIARFWHQRPHDAELLVLAVDAAAIRGDARTGDRRERPVKRPDNVADTDFSGGKGKRITAGLALFRRDKMRVAKFGEDLVEEFLGNVAGLGDFGRLRDFARRKLGEAAHRLEAVFPLICQHVRSLVS